MCPSKSEGSTPLESLTNRRCFLRTATSAGIAVTLAGCSTSESGGSGGEADGDGSGGDVGDDEETAAPLSGPVKIGVLAPLPDQTTFGEAMANSARLIASQLNADGGLLGADVEVVVKDTELKPGVTQQRYRELILSEEVDATFGVFSSESLLAIIEDIADSQVVHIAGGTGTTQLNQLVREEYERYKYLFRNLQNGEQQGLNQGRFAQEEFAAMDWQDIGLLVEDIEGYTSYARGFRNNLPDGVTIKLDEGFSAGTEDYRPLLRDAEEQEVDAVWLYASVTGTTAVNQWSRGQYDFGLGGVLVSAGSPEFFNNVSEAEYTVTGIAGGTPAYRPTDVTTEFIEAYRGEYGKLPPDYSAYTNYDAVKAWVTAVQAAESIAESDVIPALEELTYTGTMGTVEYYPRDHKWAHDVRLGAEFVTPPVVQWLAGGNDGKQVVLWPESAASGEYRSPSWVE